MMDSMIVHSMYEPPLQQEDQEFASTPEDAPTGADFQNVILEPKDYLGNSDEFYSEPPSIENSIDDSQNQNMGKMEIPSPKANKPHFDIEVESQTTLLQKANTAKRKSIFEAMKEGKLILLVEIEDYLDLQCAKTVTEFFEQKETVRVALYHLATRNSVSIDLSNGREELFDLFYVNSAGNLVLMDKNKLLDDYSLTYKVCL